MTFSMFTSVPFPKKYISYIFLRMGPKWILIPSKVKPPLLRPAKILLRFHKGFDFAMTNTGLVCMYNCIQEKHNCSLCKTCKIQWKETCFLACFQLPIFSGEEQNQSLHCIFCSAFFVLLLMNIMFALIWIFKFEHFGSPLSVHTFLLHNWRYAMYLGK